jgi:hypothetical protein
MKNLPTANQLIGRAIGSIFFAAFGALWILLSLYVKQILSVVTVSWVALDLLVLLTTAIWLLRQAKRFPKAPEDPARNRAFNRINAVQWIAIFIVAFAFGRLHLDAYAMSAITVIVGLHLFPLAKLFRYPLHYITGAVLVAWGGLTVLFVSAEHLQGTVALGTGIILWLSAFMTLIIAATVARRAVTAYSDHELQQTSKGSF